MSAWNLFSTLSTALFGTMDETLDHANMPIYGSERYAPSVQDILAVKRILIKKGELPLELVDTIIDFAEYWVRSTTLRTGREISVQAGRERENKLLLRSYPLGYMPTHGNPDIVGMEINDGYPSIPSTPLPQPGDFPHNVTQEVIDRWTRESSSRGEFPCRKIVFTIKSHDQGWGGPPACKGTYKGSSTWFDVGLEKVSAFHGSQLPPIRSPGLPKGSRGFSRSDAQNMRKYLFEEIGVHVLPCFMVSDTQPTKANSSPIICCTRTIIPTTESRQTFGEPPGTKLSFRHALDPGLDCLQKNCTATRDTKEHKITWSCFDNTDPDSIDGKKLDDEGRGRASASGEYVRNLEIGDVVTVWGKARYGGWVNNIEEVKIDVYWVV